MAAETRPADSTPFTYHWLASGRAEGRPSSEDVVPALWVAEGWHSFAEVPTITPAEMYRRGWRYHGPVAFPPGLDDAPDLPPLAPTLGAEDAAIIAAAERFEAAHKAHEDVAVDFNGDTVRAALALMSATTALTAAVRSRAAKQEAEMPQFKAEAGMAAGCHICGKRACAFVLADPFGKSGHMLAVCPDHSMQAAKVRVNSLEYMRSDPDLHADGDDREAEVVDRADEEGRRVVGLAITEAKERVVASVLRCVEWYSRGRSNAVDEVEIQNEIMSCGNELRVLLTPPAPVDPLAELDAAVVDVLTVVDMSVRANAQKVARVSRARAAVAREGRGQ